MDKDTKDLIVLGVATLVLFAVWQAWHIFF